MFHTSWIECSLILLFLGGNLPFQASQSNTPEQQKKPLATVNGVAIFETDLPADVRSQLARIQNQEYELISRALDGVVQEKLLEAEAKTRKISVKELIQQEVEDKAGVPTPAEVKAYYLGLGEKVTRPFEEVELQLAESLRKAKIQALRQALVKGLGDKAEVTILVRPPRLDVRPDLNRIKGSPKAPVMIVEFSEFQCPYCQSVQPTLAGLLAKYKGQVGVSFRDFPLRQIHPQAQAAAEAARCAGDQGKFWEYHDLLFAASGKLDSASLVQYAKNAAINESAFKTCLDSGKFRAAIEQDVQEGRRLGVTGTPAFFINGIFTSGAKSAAAFEKIIDAELTAAKSRRVNSP